ncbi:MAG TPA: DNA recombination protein RmuC [Proteobacteria bacterium]|nr:DNA recombination protein RmuC [Pseudomonadota bacterium]
MVWCSPAGVAAVLSLLCLLLWFLVWWRLGRRQDLEALLGREFRLHREEAAAAARLLREELAAGQSRAGKTVLAAVGELGRLQGEGLGAVEQRVRELAAANETRLERLREAVARQLQGLQENNDKKLEEMRRTVDEKLQSTLEKRLGESFRLVSERLEAVQRGLGDMRNLASGVGDLKRMLTNVKARGTWGEFQLGDILGQILTPEQYARNVQPKAGSGEIVEYAVRLPGSTAEAVVWLPIDAKFPQEDYQRLLEAAASADAEAEEKATGALLRSLQGSAREIALKYLDPPRTTDFAIMFLPTEGLYAEALRRPGLVEALQQQFRIVIAGPTTLAALLNSLRMGFRTLAIEKRSSEVWKLLAAVKTEFERFGTTLERLKKQLDTASTTIDKTGVRTRAMARVLREVEALPETEAERLLALENEGGAAEVDREGL